MASSTLLDEQDPQSPMPERTRSAWLRSAFTAASSISWLGERLRLMTSPWRRDGGERSASLCSSVSE